MDPETSGRFRVYASPRDRDELLFVDTGTFDPTYVPLDEEGGDGTHDADLASLWPGYLVDATLSWSDGTPRVTALDVRKRTLFAFADDVTGMFEAATETWHAAEADNEPMNARVTRNTDSEPNGVLYVFADQPGAHDLLAEFADGSRPLEPLLDRVNESRDGDHEVFVLRPADEPFVAVYIVFAKGGLLADTVRDTYDLPRPAEPDG